MYVGKTDLSLGDDIQRVLDAHAAHGGNRFKGVRQVCAWDKNPDAVDPDNIASQSMVSDSRFRAGFAALTSRGLPFDAFMFHTQIQDLIDLHGWARCSGGKHIPPVSRS
jgi:L-fuconolactonase